MNTTTTIHEQINLATYMTLGASGITTMYFRDGSEGLRFMARVHGFKANGERASQVRRMTVTIVLEATDTYKVTLSYVNRGKVVTLLDRNGVYIEDLNRLLVAMDYDGDEVLNPRLM